MCLLHTTGNPQLLNSLNLHTCLLRRKEPMDTWGIALQCCPQTTGMCWQSYHLCLKGRIWKFWIFYGNYILFLHMVDQNIKLLLLVIKGIVKIKDLEQGWNLLTCWKQQIFYLNWIHMLPVCSFVKEKNVWGYRKRYSRIYNNVRNIIGDFVYKVRSCKDFLLSV